MGESGAMCSEKGGITTVTNDKPELAVQAYCMGLALIPNIESVKKVRHNIHQTVEELKVACLLLDGDKEETFDIVIFIVEFPHPLMVQRSRLPSIVTTKAKVVGAGAILRPISSDLIYQLVAIGAYELVIFTLKI
ncbi:hypothetical protein KY290_008967 [Solanum tuberosum]|uniref:Uncharacterized protein n=1 Tax=Solanum tuberosum TaxID=4113 RepID=A0ABQ7WBD1_SOLTU|nr:hypothetical protein KY290_008967 [Solanum tuberosum]